MYEMNEILKQLGMNYKQFSEYYEIPYNTVRQWANGSRTPPSYVLKLLNEKIERETNGEQLNFFNKGCLYCKKMYIEESTEETLFYCEHYGCQLKEIAGLIPKIGCKVYFEEM